MTRALSLSPRRRGGGLFLLLTVLLFVACAGARTPAAPLRDLFGVSVGMSRDEARAKLGAVGSMQREERKRQEVWTVRDRRFEGAIVGYDADWKVRFITAVARADGARVRFADVLDLAAAAHQTTGTAHKYRWQPAGAAYTIVAIGNDPERVTYLTLTSGEE